MARPLKQGMDYFPHDTDASSDEKIDALRILYGNDGYAFYFILLERIYLKPDFELDVSDAETIQILARKVGVTPEQFREMLKTALKRRCFCPDEYEKRGVLTSPGIKKRSSVVVNKRQKMASAYQNRVSDAETPPETRVSDEFPSREKKSKVNKNISSAANATEGGNDEKVITLTHKIRLIIEQAYTGYAWSAKDAKHAKELAEKLAVSFRTTQHKEPTDEDLLSSLATLLTRMGKLTPYYQFQDVPKLNERYNSIVAQIKKPNPTALGQPSVKSVSSGRQIA